MLRRSALHGSIVLFSLSTVLACSQLLGVEEPGDGGAGGSSTGGKTGAGGKGSSGGETGASGGADGNVGGSNEPAGGRTSSGGDTSEGGERPDGGSDGNGGSGGTTPVSKTVTGRIIDLFDRPMAMVTVSISGADAVQTKLDGTFEVEDVPDSYDVEFEITARGGYYRRLYIFEGMSRRDPTFQVDKDVGDSEARITIAPTNLPQPTGDLVFAIGSPVDALYFTDEGGISSSEAVVYDGTDPVTFPTHALYWNEGVTPPAFYGYAERNLILNDSDDVEVALDSWTTISNAAQVNGKATGFSTAVNMQVFVDLPSGAALPLQSVATAEDSTYSLVVPLLGKGETYRVVGRVPGDGYSYSLSHQGAVSGGADGVDLVVTAPPFLVGPSDTSTDVDETTRFSWGAADAGPCSLVTLQTDFNRRSVHVVTCEESLGLRAEHFNGILQSGDEVFWSVNSNGAQESVDEMTGPEGFYDTFFDGYYAGGYPRGAKRVERGSFARSTFWTFYVR